MTLLRFSKMHGLGNDFMVIDAINQRVSLDKQKIAALARRDTGVGFDQCLLVEASKDPDIDFFYRIFNADGEEVGQCGNGARCLARFVQHYALSHQRLINVATKTTRMQLQLNDDETVTVCFAKPILAPAFIPLKADKEAVTYYLPLANGSRHPVHALSVGNPHALTLITDLAHQSLDALGKEISEHIFFPEKVNAGFMEIMDKHLIHLRVYERGVGETKACGSGAVAAAAVARLFYGLEPSICVKLTGGMLHVRWPDTSDAIFLTGPAHFVYEGVLYE